MRREEEGHTRATEFISAFPKIKETSLDACTLALHYPEKEKSMFRDALTTLGVHFTAL